MQKKRAMFIYSRLIKHNFHNVIQDKANKISIPEENNYLKGGNINYTSMKTAVHWQLLLFFLLPLGTKLLQDNKSAKIFFSL